MRSLKTAIGFCSALLPFLLKAQPVIIQGTAKSFNNSKIEAYSYKDYITYTPLKLASAQTNDTGGFSLTLPDIKRTGYLYLSISNLRGSIYVSPGNTYHVIFPAPDSTQYANPYVSHMVDLNFLNHDSDNINTLVMDFNHHYDAFYNQYYTYILRKQGARFLDTFYLQMQNFYSEVHNSYFDAYMRYSVAETGINIMEGTKTLGKKFLEQKPILYHNYEYMKFFNDYFNNYLEQLVLGKTERDVKNFIAQNDYPNLMEVMKVNPILRENDSLCELALLKGLYELYYSGEFSQTSIKSLIQTTQAQSKIDEDKVIAADMLSSFSDVVKGATSPDFALKDAKGNISGGVDFRGRYLYLCFFKSSSEACLSELDVMAALYKKYGKKMNFVCVSEDKNISDLESFLDQNKLFNWTFLYDEGGKVLEKFDVKALPEFFLINPQGYFYMSPADGPSHGIEITFDQILPHKKQNNQ